MEGWTRECRAKSGRGRRSRMRRRRMVGVWNMGMIGWVPLVAVVVVVVVVGMVVGRRRRRRWRRPRPRATDPTDHLTTTPPATSLPRLHPHPHLHPTTPHTPRTPKLFTAHLRLCVVGRGCVFRSWRGEEERRGRAHMGPLARPLNTWSLMRNEHFFVVVYDGNIAMSIKNYALPMFFILTNSSLN